MSTVSNLNKLLAVECYLCTTHLQSFEFSNLQNFYEHISDRHHQLLIEWLSEGENPTVSWIHGTKNSFVLTGVSPNNQLTNLEITLMLAKYGEIKDILFQRTMGFTLFFTPSIKDSKKQHLLMGSGLKQGWKVFNLQDMKKRNWDFLKTQNESGKKTTAGKGEHDQGQETNNQATHQLNQQQDDETGVGSVQASHGGTSLPKDGQRDSKKLGKDIIHLIDNRGTALKSKILNVFEEIMKQNQN